VPAHRHKRVDELLQNSLGQALALRALLRARERDSPRSTPDSLLTPQLVQKGFALGHHRVARHAFRVPELEEARDLLNRCFLVGHRVLIERPVGVRALHRVKNLVLNLLHQLERAAHVSGDEHQAQCEVALDARVEGRGHDENRPERRIRLLYLHLRRALVVLPGGELDEAGDELARTRALLSVAADVDAEDAEPINLLLGVGHLFGHADRKRERGGGARDEPEVRVEQPLGLVPRTRSREGGGGNLAVDGVKRHALDHRPRNPDQVSLHPHRVRFVERGLDERYASAGDGILERPMRPPRPELGRIRLNLRLDRSLQALLVGACLHELRLHQRRGQLLVQRFGGRSARVLGHGVHDALHVVHCSHLEQDCVRRGQSEAEVALRFPRSEPEPLRVLHLGENRLRAGDGGTELVLLFAQESVVEAALRVDALEHNLSGAYHRPLRLPRRRGRWRVVVAGGCHHHRRLLLFAFLRRLSLALGRTFDDAEVFLEVGVDFREHRLLEQVG